MDSVAAIAHCFRTLGWSALSIDQLVEHLRQFERQTCFLRQSLAKCLSTVDWLTESGRHNLEQLAALDLTLRLSWNRRWHKAINVADDGIYVGHCRVFDSRLPLTSIVSSRLGRGNRLLPDWPKWIEFSLQTLKNNRGRLLVAPETPVFPMIVEYAQLLDLPLIHLRVVNLEGTTTPLVEWFHCALANKVQASEFGDDLWFFQNEADHQVHSVPVRDRLSVLLPDLVFALAVRKGGNMEQVLKHRLAITDIPVGTTYIAIDRHENDPAIRAKAWLDNGAVGWYLHPATSTTISRSMYCRSAPSATRHTQQLASPISESKFWIDQQDEDGFVAHCTRGQEAPSFTKFDNGDGSLAQYWQKTILAGSELPSSPFSVLMKICMEQRLVSTSTWTRDGSRVVSFTSKPLPQVLSNRRFQSHLGRWDWEPYGILIRRAALRTLGGSPVIYGDQATFDQLPPDQRPFFQLAKRRKSLRHSDWIDEQEWRSVGDVRLSDLSPEDVGVFVATRREALALARHCKWPVYWLRDS